MDYVHLRHLWLSVDRSPQLNFDVCMYVCNVAIARTNIRVLFTLLFAVGSDISILKAPMAAAISPFMSPTEPSQPMMSDGVNDEA